MTEFIKFKIQQHNSAYRNYHQKNSKSLDHEILQSEIENVASITSERNSDYIQYKLAQKLIIYKLQNILVYLKNFLNG